MLYFILKFTNYHNNHCVNADILKYNILASTKGLEHCINIHYNQPSTKKDKSKLVIPLRKKAQNKYRIQRSTKLKD